MYETYAKKLVGELVRSFDVLVTLASGCGAPPVEGLSTETFSKYPSFTSFWNGMGLPALCIPMGFTNDGLPLSMQIVGKPFDEATILRVGDAFQQVTDWDVQVPAMAVAALVA